MPSHKQIFYRDDLSPYDIQCGLIKNSNIISVFSHLADYPLILTKLFPENNINEIGIYRVRLFFTQQVKNLFNFIKIH